MSVNVLGVFNINGLRCFEDVECERCAVLLNVVLFCVLVNLMGV